MRILGFFASSFSTVGKFGVTNRREMVAMPRNDPTGSTSGDGAGNPAVFNTTGGELFGDQKGNSEASTVPHLPDPYIYLEPN